MNIAYVRVSTAEQNEQRQIVSGKGGETKNRSTLSSSSVCSSCRELPQ